jgi:hypothetical protein
MAFSQILGHRPADRQAKLGTVWPKPYRGLTEDAEGFAAGVGDVDRSVRRSGNDGVCEGKTLVSIRFFPQVGLAEGGLLVMEKE